jgi:hypothetical protein
MNRFLRGLLIGDDIKRMDVIKNWMSIDVRLVHAASADRALEILNRGWNAFAGRMLHHELRNLPAQSTGRRTI